MTLDIQCVGAEAEVSVRNWAAATRIQDPGRYQNALVIPIQRSQIALRYLPLSGYLYNTIYITIQYVPSKEQRENKGGWVGMHAWTWMEHTSLYSLMLSLIRSSEGATKLTSWSPTKGMVLMTFGTWFYLVRYLSLPYSFAQRLGRAHAEACSHRIRVRR